MDPSRKRAVRTTVALSAALLLATALIYVSFAAGDPELTAAEYAHRAHPGQTYVLAGTVKDGSVARVGTTLYFKIIDPHSSIAVPVKYSGIVPDPFAQGRAVLVTVTDQNGQAIGQQNSLTTKCPSKYQVAAGAQSD